MILYITQNQIALNDAMLFQKHNQKLILLPQSSVQQCNSLSSYFDKMALCLTQGHGAATSETAVFTPSLRTQG